MTDKEFNPYDEYAARCVHQFPQEKEYTFSSSGDSKMYTSGSVANTQRMLTEIKESGSIGKIRIWVEINTVKHQRHLE